MEWNVLMQFASPVNELSEKTAHEVNKAMLTMSDGRMTRTRRIWPQRILFTWINVIAVAILCGSMLVIIIIVAARAHYNI